MIASIKLIYGNIKHEDMLEIDSKTRVSDGNMHDKRGIIMLKSKLKDIVDIGSIGNRNPLQLNDILKLASIEKVSPSSEDKEKTLFIGIDFQNDFMENGELAVPNSHKDVENVLTFLYRNLHMITDIAVSLDTHILHQIFHPSWWLDKDGNHPEPYTIISEEDVQQEKWMAVEKEQESLEYIQQLEKQGRMKLCIWPYHCIEGTYGAALEGQYSNMIHFHSIVRQAPINKIVKGKDPLSEMYGIIKPEYDRNNYVNTGFLQSLRNYDKIFIAGEAKSHCVLETLRQILEHYSDDLHLTSRIYVLNDCMSPIPGFEKMTEDTMEHFHEKYRINIVNSQEFAMDISEESGSKE